MEITQNIGIYTNGSKFTIKIDFVKNVNPVNNVDGVAVILEKPVGVSFVSYGSSKGTYDDISGIWAIGTLTPLEQVSATFTFEVTNDAINDFKFTFSVSTAPGCPACLSEQIYCVVVSGISCSDIKSCPLVGIVTTLVDNEDGTVTYISEDLTETTFNQGWTTVTILPSNALRFTYPDGGEVNYDEILTSISYDNTTGIITYIDEDGTSNPVDLSSGEIVFEDEGSRTVSKSNIANAIFDLHRTLHAGVSSHIGANLIGTSFADAHLSTITAITTSNTVVVIGGTNSTNTGLNSIVSGNNVTNSGNRSIVTGNTVVNSGRNSFISGSNINNEGDNAIVTGMAILVGSSDNINVVGIDHILPDTMNNSVIMGGDTIQPTTQGSAAEENQVYVPFLHLWGGPGFSGPLILPSLEGISSTPITHLLVADPDDEFEIKRVPFSALDECHPICINEYLPSETPSSGEGEVTFIVPAHMDGWNISAIIVEGDVDSSNVFINSVLSPIGTVVSTGDLINLNLTGASAATLHAATIDICKN